MVGRQDASSHDRSSTTAGNVSPKSRHKYVQFPQKYIRSRVRALITNEAFIRGSVFKPCRDGFNQLVKVHATDLERLIPHERRMTMMNQRRHT